MFNHPALRFAALTASPALLLSLLSGCATNAPATGALAPSTIDGRCIAVLCDADMSATTLFDGQLGSHKGGDMLTTVLLPISDAPDATAGKWSTKVAQIPVSNSALGPPCGIAVTADGRRAFTVECHKAATSAATTVETLPRGTQLVAVDLADPAAPHVMGTLDVGISPVAVDVNKDGDLVAVATQTPGQQIVVVRSSAMEPLGKKYMWPLAGVASASAKPSSIAWRPAPTVTNGAPPADRQYLAVTVPETNQVCFYEYRKDAHGEESPGLAPWGAPITVGKFPFSGRFSNDGRFFIYTELMWGPDVEGFMTGAPEGRVGVIRLSDVESCVNADGQLNVDSVQHEVLGGVTVGVSPEVLAMSPTGTELVTGNLKRSFLPEGDERLTPGGSLSLLSFNTDSGSLSVRSETPIKGMPKGVTFDATGKHIIVSEFRSFDPEATEGELAFYTVGGSRLKFCGFYVSVGSGPHGVVVAR